MGNIHYRNEPTKIKLRTYYDESSGRWIILATANGEKEVRYDGVSFASKGIAESYIDKLILKEFYAYERA